MNSIQNFTSTLTITLFLATFLPIHSVIAAQQSLDTELIESVRNNNVSEVKNLISLGANPFAKDTDGLEAVEIAIDRGFFKIAHYLQAVQNQKRDSLAKTTNKTSRTADRAMY